MTWPAPRIGLVVAYNYLWRSEHDQGNEEARKRRPCAIILEVVERNTQTIVLVSPITHRPPSNPREAIELPFETKRRLRLDDDDPSWIVLTEVNAFVWPGPDLLPIRGDKRTRFAYGFLPAGLIRAARAKLATLLRERRLEIVKRV